MAIGGYTTAILMAGNEQFGGPISGGMQDVWTLPIAGLVAGLVGLAFGLPGAPPVRPLPRARDVRDRRRDAVDGEALRGVLRRRPGHPALRPAGADRLECRRGCRSGRACTFELLGLTFTPNDWMYYLAWSIALVLFAGAWLILRGRTGRAFRAVRDSETAAVSSGVSLARYKTLAFGISAAYAGVAGGLFAIASAFVNPDTFPVALSIFLLVGIVIGGLGGLSGLVFGAIFVAFIQLWAQGQDLGSLLPDRDHRGDAEARRRRRSSTASCSSC